MSLWEFLTHETDENLNIKMGVFINDTFVFGGTRAEIYKVLSVALMDKLKVVKVMNQNGSELYIDVEVINND